MALNQTLSDISRYLPIPQEALRLSESYFEVKESTLTGGVITHM